MKKHKKGWFYLLFFPCLFFLQCKDQPVTPDETGYQYTQPVQTGDGWETGTLGSSGMDKTMFEDMVNDIDEGVKDSLRFLFQQTYFPNSQPNCLTPGKYCIKICVYSDNAQTKELFFKIIWSGEWKDTEEEIFEEIKIAQIKKIA